MAFCSMQLHLLGGRLIWARGNLQGLDVLAVLLDAHFALAAGILTWSH